MTQSRGTVESFLDYDLVFKYVVVGDSGVGKSSLLLRFTEGYHQDNYTSTIGVDFRIKNVNINDRKVKLQVWDTAGQDRFKSVCTQFYRGANAVVIVYDVSDIDSFSNIRQWYNEVVSRCSAECIIYMVGNKADLNESRAVSSSDAQALADSLNVTYIETSAKEDKNVTDMFMTIAKELCLKTSCHELQEDTDKINFNKNSATLKRSKSKLGYFNCLDCTVM